RSSTVVITHCAGNIYFGHHLEQMARHVIDVIRVLRRRPALDGPRRRLETVFVRAGYCTVVAVVVADLRLQADVIYCYDVRDLKPDVGRREICVMDLK